MTISDIARMAGVSSAAVSRYLNGGPLSEQKRAIIREVVEKTGYRPDTTAQTLRTGKVNQVGVIAPSIGSQSVGQLTAGIASELDARNYLLLKRTPVACIVEMRTVLKACIADTAQKQ